MTVPRHQRTRRQLEITLGEEAFARLERLSQRGGFNGNRSRVVEQLVLAATLLRVPSPRRVKAG